MIDLIHAKSKSLRVLNTCSVNCLVFFAVVACDAIAPFKILSRPFVIVVKIRDDQWKSFSSSWHRQFQKIAFIESSKR